MLREIISSILGRPKEKSYSMGDEMWLSSPLYGKALDWQTSRVVAKELEPYYKDDWFHNHSEKYLCKRCHRILKKEIDVKYRAKKCKADLYFTNDGYLVADDRFKKFCMENNYPGLVFDPLPNSPGYYWFYPTIIYDLDWGRGITERTRICPECGHTCFFKAIPLFKMPDYSPYSNDFIYRSDIEIGDDLRSPLIIIGLKTEAKLLKAGFKGFKYIPVYY